MATVVWSNWQRWSVHLSPSEGSLWVHHGATCVTHDASLMPFYDDNFANSENYYIWSVHLSPSEGTLWISGKDTSGNIFHQPVRLVLPSHLLLSYFCYFIKSLLFYLVVPSHLFVISYHILCSRSYLSSAHIFPWVSVMMGQSCIPAIATVFRTEMVHYREVCVFGPTLSFQSNLFNSLSWYYITWTGTQTSQQAPSPLSPWEEISSVKLYFELMWWGWPRRRWMMIWW